MTKDLLLKKIEKAWNNFQGSYAGLSQTAMLEAGVTGDWSIKDIIAHVTTWEKEAIKHLPAILAGRRPERYSVEYGGIDSFNARMTEVKRKLSLAKVFRDQKATHRRLVDYIKTISEDQVATETTARRRIRLDCYGHYPIHAKAITDWRARRGI